MPDSKVFKLKVSLLGDGAVGKTSLIKKYVYDEFDDKYLLTLGAKTTLKKIPMVSEESGTHVECNLMIWDIMGQKEFERLHKTFFRGTKGAFVITDITRRETLESVDDWLTRLFDVTGPIPLVFVINKCDLMDKAEFKKEELEQIAMKYNAEVYMCSARTGEHVDEFFYNLGQKLVEKSLFEKLKPFVPEDAAPEPEAEAPEPEAKVVEAAEEAAPEPPKKEPEAEAAPPSEEVAPPAEAATAVKIDDSLPLIQKLQAHVDAINDHFEKFKVEIQAFEEEKKKLAEEKDAPPAKGGDDEEGKPSAKSSISWED